MPWPRDSLRYRCWIRAGGWLGARFLQLLGRSWRIHLSGPDPFAAGQPFVAAIWHRGLLIGAYCWRGRGIAIPVSRSRDGDLVDGVLQHLGFARSPRGSSSKGATSLLRAMLRRTRAGETVAVLPDGPRGPAGMVKPGVIALARLSELRLVPVGIAAAPCIRFRSWDGALLPHPFARVHCRYGTPFQVPKSASESELEVLRQHLERELHRLDRELGASLAGEGQEES